jgi:glycosyltransferase involved in cell wall biosynthesis
MTGRTVQIVCGAGIVSGKEIVSLLLAHGLRDAGWTPAFITSSWGDGEFVRRLEQDGFNYQLLRLGFISASLRCEPLLMTLDQLRYWPGLAYKYGRLVAALFPRAIIHTNWHHALLLRPFLKPQRDIFWVHECFPQSLRYGVMLRAIANKVGRVVCVSQAVARSVVALGVPKRHVTVIHHGLPRVDSMHVGTDRTKLRLGIVGQIGPWKGHEDLFDALALLARDGIRVALRIFGAGDPDYVATLKERIAQLNLNDQIQWCGFTANQDDIYVHIDVCVQPSRCDEPFGMSALEAGSFGRPVICSSRGGLPEIVQNGVTGFVVDAKRPDLLAETIRLFVQRPELVKTMGVSAKKRVQSEFSLARCVSQFEQVIEELK